MSIDWITVGAQIVNFLVLVWLLKRFLYRPILDGIDARESRIATRMSEARQIQETADAARAEYEAEIARLKAGREGVIEEARDTARQERDALLAEARDRLRQEQAARDEARERDARAYAERLHESGAAAILALTRKALADLSDETLEQRIVARAATRIDDMMADLGAAAGDAQRAIVTTQAPLPTALRAEIGARMEAALPEIGIDFRTDPDQSAGLGIRLGGAQLGWTVDSYMDGLGQILDDHRAARERTDAA